MTPSTKEIKDKPDHITYRVKSIELVDSKIDTKLIAGLNKAALDLKDSLAVDVNIYAETNSVEFFVEFKLFRDEKALFSMRVKNEFEIENLSTLLVGEDIKPDHFYQFLLNLSMHQSRGVQSQIIKGTLISDLYMPVVPVSKVLANQVNS
jgi:hypothetical protein